MQKKEGMVLFIESDVNAGFRNRLLRLCLCLSGEYGLLAVFVGKLTKENDFRMQKIYVSNK